jgi:hypothetical protein
MSAGGVPRPRRGESVALIGLAGSGKTSFLFALRHAHDRPTALRWLWPASNAQLEQTAPHPGELLPSTAPGTFKVARLHVLRRKWRRPPSLPARWLPPWLRLPRRVNVPEVAGEYVRDFARGASAEGRVGEGQEVFRQFGAYLSSCDEVLFLAGLRSPRAEGVLRQESVGSSAYEAADCLDKILGHIRASRASGRHDPIFATFVVTKRDAVRGIPGLDVVRLPVSESALVRLSSSVEAAARLYRIDEAEGEVSFSLNGAADAAGGDVDLQEAIAVDFLACHAPEAAKLLAGIAQRPGVSLRVLTGKPLGYECRTNDGRSAAPDYGQLQSSMVWESVDDLVERSFRWRVRRFAGRAGITVMAIVLGVFLLGPVAAWTCRERASAAIARGDVEAARGWLGWNDSNPWTIVERSRAPHMRADAEAWKALLDLSRQQGSAAEDLEQEVFGRDPYGDLAGPAVLKRNLARLQRFLEGDPRLADGSPEHLAMMAALRGAGHVRIAAREVDELGRAVRALRGSGPFPFERPGDEAQYWREVARRLRSVASWIGPGARDEPAIVQVGLEEADADRLAFELERSALAADLRAELRVQLPRLVGKPLAQDDLKALQGQAERAARANDMDSLRRIDQAMRRSLADAPAEPTSDARGGPVVPDVRTALAGDPWWAPAESLRRELALRNVLEGIGRLSEAFARGDRTLKLSREASSVRGAIETLGGDAIPLGGDLAGMLDRADALTRAAEELRNGPPVEGSAAQLSTRLQSLRELKSPIEISLGQDGPTAHFDPVQFAERCRADLEVELLKRLGTMADELLEGRCTRRDVDATQRALEAVLPQGASLPGWISLLLDAERAARGEDPKVRERVRAFVDDGFLRERLPALMTLFGRSEAVSSVGVEAARALAPAPGWDPLTPTIRVRAARALLDQVQDERWLKGSGPAQWQDTLLAAAQECGVDGKELVCKRLEGALDEAFRPSVKPGTGGSRGEVSLGPARFWRDRALALSVDRSRLKTCFQGAIRSLAAEAKQSGLAPGRHCVREGWLKLLCELPAGQPNAMADIAEIVSDLERHRALIKDHQLVAVRGADGAVEFYIGAYEVRRERLRTSHGPHVEQEVSTSLGFGRLADARSAAAALGEGVRLPTRQEWAKVEQRRGDRPAAGVKASLLDRQKRRGLSANADPASLEECGDRVDLEDGRIVGLEFGVREWCSDSPDRSDGPSGSSYDDLDPRFRVALEERAFKDVGFRIALDPLPGSLRGG